MSELPELEPAGDARPGCTSWITPVKDLLQIVGIFIGAGWVLLTFGLKECPAREPRLEMKSGLRWAATSRPDTCSALWSVSVENISARSVDIDHVTAGIWKYQPPVPAGKPAYVDLANVTPKEYLDERHFEAKRGANPPPPFIGRYSPKAANHHTFEWIFPRPATEQWVVMELKLFRGRKDEPIGAIYEWSRVCPQ